MLCVNAKIKTYSKKSNSKGKNFFVEKKESSISSFKSTI